MNSFGKSLMNPLFTGQEITELESVDSTNSYATELLKHRNLTEGHVVWAKRQTHGRGQRGNNWESEAGSNVTMSVIWYPVFLSPSRQFMLTQAVALGVSDFLSYKMSEAGIRSQIRIKWPNDVLANEQKIAGILIENSIRNGSVAYSIVGIGINVNQVDFTSVNKPVSIKLITGRHYDIRVCVEELCAFLEPRYLQLRGGKHDQMHEEYLSRLYRLNEWAYYSSAGNRFAGRIVGVAPGGYLQMELENGERVAFDFKEVTFL